MRALKQYIFVQKSKKKNRCHTLKVIKIALKQHLNCIPGSNKKANLQCFYNIMENVDTIYIFFFT